MSEAAFSRSLNSRKKKPIGEDARPVCPELYLISRCRLTHLASTFLPTALSLLSSWTRPMITPFSYLHSCKTVT